MIDREGFYVEPTIVTGLPHDSPVVHRETFAPIVYALKCPSLDTGIQWNNEVNQGLSSSLFTQNLGNVFKVGFLMNYCDSNLVINVLNLYKKDENERILNQK